MLTNGKERITKDSDDSSDDSSDDDSDDSSDDSSDGDETDSKSSVVVVYHSPVRVEPVLWSQTKIDRLHSAHYVRVTPDAITVKTRKFERQFFKILPYSKYIWDTLDSDKMTYYDLFVCLNLCFWCVKEMRRMFDRKTLHMQQIRAPETGFCYMQFI